MGESEDVMITKIVDCVSLDRISNDPASTRQQLERYCATAQAALQAEYPHVEVSVVSVDREDQNGLTIETDDPDTFNGDVDRLHAQEQVEDFIGRNWSDWF